LKKFYAYFSKEEITSLLKKAGFESAEITVEKHESSYLNHNMIMAICKKPIRNALHT
jgi:hypothetical protein